jgi:hypothetical protein
MTIFTFRAFARRGAGLVVLLLLVSPAVTARGASKRTDFDERVLSCEEARAKLERCCPDFPVRTIQCVDDEYETQGCGMHSYGHKLPAYTLAESRCIRETPCENLVKSSVCVRAAAVTRRGQSTTIDLDENRESSKNYDTQPAVCP